MLTISVLDTRKKTRTNFEKNPEVSNGQNLREHWTVSLNFSISYIKIKTQLIWIVCCDKIHHLVIDYEVCFSLYMSPSVL